MALGRIDKLAMMANQIAQFFRSYPHDQAVTGIAHHIEAFWTPKMRSEFSDGLHDLPHLDPLVVEAMSSGGGGGRNPLARAAAGPGAVGELGAVDAG